MSDMWALGHGQTNEGEEMRALNGAVAFQDILMTTPINHSPEAMVLLGELHNAEARLERVNEKRKVYRLQLKQLQRAHRITLSTVRDQDRQLREQMEYIVALERQLDGQDVP